MAMRRPDNKAHNSRADSGGRMVPAARSGRPGAVPEMPGTGTIALRPALDTGGNPGIVLRGEAGAGAASARAGLASATG
jgi:hypothetical protein